MINLFRFFVRDLNIRSFQVLRIELFCLMLNVIEVELFNSFFPRFAIILFFFLVFQTRFLL